MKKEKPKYLISDFLYHKAQQAAIKLSLSSDEWIYIPYERTAREITIKGLTVPHERYLVGAFTDIERARIIKRV